MKIIGTFDVWAVRKIERVLWRDDVVSVRNLFRISDAVAILAM